MPKVWRRNILWQCQSYIESCNPSNNSENSNINTENNNARTKWLKKLTKKELEKMQKKRKSAMYNK